MKTYLLTIFLILSIGAIGFAQNFSIGDQIVLTNDVPVETSMTLLLFSEVEHADKTLAYLEAGVKFKVLEIADAEVKLIAIPYEKLKDAQKNKIDGIVKRDYYNNKVYTISLKNFNAFAKKVEEIERVSIGILTLPFKARLQDDISFDTEFNLSTTLNINCYNFNKFSLNAQLGAGIGSVDLNTNNASGIEENKAQDVATLTTFIGAMVQFSNIQVGLYLGVDHINNQKNYQWESNGNLWVGFGIGFDVFSISTSSPKNKQL